MSRWATNPSSWILSQEEGSIIEPQPDTLTSPESSGAEEKIPSDKNGAPIRTPGWAKFVPFFLSAFFFLSGLLVVFAPLPLLFLHFRKGRKWAWPAFITNSICVAWAAGSLSLLFYLVFVVSIAAILPEFLVRKKSLERSVVWTFLTMILMGGLAVGGYSYLHHLNPVHELESQVNEFVRFLSQSLPSTSGMMNQADMDEGKRTILTSFPSALAIFGLVLIWANLVVVLRANPNQVRDRLGLDPAFLKKWKAPDFLVWPTLATGAFLVFEVDGLTDVCLNVFKLLMAVYAIQGLSILSFFFDLWGIRGLFRWIGYFLTVFLMMPLLLSLGFFDLWFDFRSKFRQS